MDSVKISTITYWNCKRGDVPFVRKIEKRMSPDSPWITIMSQVKSEDCCVAIATTVWSDGTETRVFYVKLLTM